MLRSGKDNFIGKVLEPATEARSLEDIRRNVWSLLQRVCPDRRDEGEIRLYALESEEPTMLHGGLPQPGNPYSNEEDDDFRWTAVWAHDPGDFSAQSIARWAQKPFMRRRAGRSLRRMPWSAKDGSSDWAAD